MKKTVFLFSALIFGAHLSAQVSNPIITSWKINTTGHTVTPPGGSPILTDVEAVYYDNSNVYVKTSGVPGYYDFNNGNVNDAADKNFTFQLPLNPQVASTPPSTLGGGQMGVLTDGSIFFNPEDARSYQNANIWHQLAYYFEAVDFDSTWGHSAPSNDYHHHVISLALCDITDSTHHSPLIGFGFDGYPVYGPYGYSNATDTSSTIKRLKPSWQKRNITQRTTLPDNTALQPSQYGPNTSPQYPLGCYREDYVFVNNSGDLDTHNGRFCKTPEYPNGTYAYFATIDDALHPLYPEYIGQTFYGVPNTGNQGPQGGHFSIPGNATQYFSPTGIAGNTISPVTLYPNPTTGTLQLQLSDNKFKGTAQITDMVGRRLSVTAVYGPSSLIDVSELPAGFYVLILSSSTSGNRWSSPFVKQ